MEGPNKPVPIENMQDRLVWKATKDGKYSVKEGYKQITGQNNAGVPVSISLWQTISKWKGIAPRVKIFLWRLLHRALPMAVNMHVRLPNFSPIFQRCQDENEDETQCLFLCPTSRQVWFGSVLGIRVHGLPLNIHETVLLILSNLDEEGTKIFAYTIWEILKARNKVVIEHCIFQPQEVIKRIGAALRKETVLDRSGMVRRGECAEERYDVCQGGWQVLMDASWVNTGKSGGAYIVYENGRLHSIGLHTFEAYDAFMAEALTLRESLRYIDGGIGIEQNMRVQFFSDCINLVDAVNQGESWDIPSWRTTRTVAEIISCLNSFQYKATLHHAKRDAIQRAHLLACIARRKEINYKGQPDMNLQQNGCLDMDIDVGFFQQVQEAPP
ncbi:Ribonuclease H-like superfamily protein [Rhynchospora pubera]|uniref:Ribonuclease H-like superfamily protein n=1 Tax=Rhynchospora pubera TaxID=906938 RepID=A0AAV8ELQ2_9POAL|nr:Ribonuclease H-like superfamily protein [Rhynchospora pubera]